MAREGGARDAACPSDRYGAPTSDVGSRNDLRPGLDPCYLNRGSWWPPAFLGRATFGTFRVDFISERVFGEGRREPLGHPSGNCPVTGLASGRRCLDRHQRVRTGAASRSTWRWHRSLRRAFLDLRAGRESLRRILDLLARSSAAPDGAAQDTRLPGPPPDAAEGNAGQRAQGANASGRKAAAERRRPPDPSRPRNCRLTSTASPG